MISSNKEMHEVLREKAYDLRVEMVKFCDLKNENFHERALTVEILNRLHELSALELEEEQHEKSYIKGWPEDIYAKVVSAYQSWLSKANQTCGKIGKR